MLAMDGDHWIDWFVVWFIYFFYGSELELSFFKFSHISSRLKIFEIYSSLFILYQFMKKWRFLEQTTNAERGEREVEWCYSLPFQNQVENKYVSFVETCQR